MRSAAIAIACSPDEQKRLMVIAEISTGKPGPQRGNAGNVHSLLRLGRGTAEDHVFDLFGIHLGHALKRALDGDGGQFVGTGGAQCALKGASHRGANRGDNDDFSHGSFEWLM